MVKSKIGDVFEVKVGNMNAYFQLVQTDKLKGDLIKVFNSLHEFVPSLEDMVLTTNFYFVRFPLTAAIKSSIVKRIGNVTLPSDFKLPEYMRSKHVINGEFLGWHIIDTSTWKRTLSKQLTDLERSFSPWGIWNDTLLITRLEEGWSPEKWV